MSAPELSKHLQLSVTNLGPIAKADIELRPMTVFVGPSNTGKSYLAILIYALHRFFGGGGLWRTPRRHIGRLFVGQVGFGFGPYPEEWETISLDDLKPLLAWLEESEPTATSGHSPEAADLTLPESAAKLVRPWLEAIGDYAQVLDAEIARCFGVEETAGLVRNQVAKGSRVTVRRTAADASGASTSLGYSYTFRRNHRELASRVPIGALLRLPVSEQLRRQVLGALRWAIYEADEDDEIVVDVEDQLGSLSESVRRGMVSPLSLTAHYLPADRTGIMHAHRIVVQSLIGQAARAGFERDSPLPRLSGVLADFLEQLIGLEEPTLAGARRHRESLAEQIEREILQGEIRTARSPVGYPEFFYRPEGWKYDLGLMNTSSMVSELAPVVLYLRYVVRPGETLIIEEPESHLHPALQVEFTRQLAAVALSGVRVIITTHSEWVLEELANLVRLSELPKSRRKGIGSAPYALGRDQLGVWRFEPKKRPKGSVVREIPFNPDIGNFDSGFDRVAMATYNDQAEIIRREERLKTNAGHH